MAIMPSSPPSSACSTAGLELLLDAAELLEGARPAETKEAIEADSSSSSVAYYIINSSHANTPHSPPLVSPSSSSQHSFLDDAPDCLHRTDAHAAGSDQAGESERRINNSDVQRHSLLLKLHIKQSAAGKNGTGLVDTYADFPALQPHNQAVAAEEQVRAHDEEAALPVGRTAQEGAKDDVTSKKRGYGDVMTKATMSDSDDTHKCSQHEVGRTSCEGGAFACSATIQKCHVHEHAHESDSHPSTFHEDAACLPLSFSTSKVESYSLCFDNPREQHPFTDLFYGLVSKQSLPSQHDDQAGHPNPVPFTTHAQQSQHSDEDTDSPYSGLSTSASFSTSPNAEDASSATRSPEGSGIAKRAQTALSCLRCRTTHKKCDEERPCRRCVRVGKHDCEDAPPRGVKMKVKPPTPWAHRTRPANKRRRMEPSSDGLPGSPSRDKENVASQLLVVDDFKLPMPALASPTKARANATRGTGLLPGGNGTGYPSILLPNAGHPLHRSNVHIFSTSTSSTGAREVLGQQDRHYKLPPLNQAVADQARPFLGCGDERATSALDGSLRHPFRFDTQPLRSLTPPNVMLHAEQPANNTMAARHAMHSPFADFY